MVSRDFVCTQIGLKQQMNIVHKKKNKEDSVTYSLLESSYIWSFLSINYWYSKDHQLSPKENLPNPFFFFLFSFLSIISCWICLIIVWKSVFRFWFEQIILTWYKGEKCFFFGGRPGGFKFKKCLLFY